MTITASPKDVNSRLRNSRLRDVAEAVRTGGAALLNSGVERRRLLRQAAEQSAGAGTNEFQ